MIEKFKSEYFVQILLILKSKVGDVKETNVINTSSYGDYTHETAEREIQ